MSRDLLVDDIEGEEFSHEETSIKPIEKPSLPRNETNLCGLKNQRATCYLNVLIQTLLFTPDFREPLFCLTPKDLNLPANYNDQNSATPCGNNPKVRKIIVELQRLFAEMLLLNQESCSSIRLTESFGWQSNEAVDHQDVHELNRLLFDAIQKSLQGTKQSNLIRFCYEGSTINYTQCKRCQKIFKRKEDYHDLPLVVQDSPNVQTSLANMFTVREQLVGDNQYRCSSCSNSLGDAEKWAKITELPPILTLPLQRFVYDIKTGSRQKKASPFEFPFELDLKEFCEDSVAETNYELFAVVIHRGTCYSGHYYGYIKDIDQIGIWIPPPTPTTKSTTKKKSSNGESNTSSNENRSSNALVEAQVETMKRLDLVKTLLLSYDDWVNIEALLKAFHENTSTSWNRSSGVRMTFTKFLRNHPEAFEVDDKRVRLIPQSFPMEVDQAEVDEMDFESSQNEDTSTSDHGKEEHWFCFDDTVVTCVTRRQIMKHYGQNDCAYMLFYRQKARDRSQMDCSDTLHSIPQWLIDEITEKNHVLHENRETYVKYQNLFQVTVYPSEWFKVIDDRRLNLCNDNQVLFPDRYGEHTFDKRTKISDFIAKLEIIYGIGSHFYVAKKLRSGQLHVMSELNNSSDKSTLDKSDLLNYRNMIVYRKSSLPDTVLQGEEFEPVMLNIVYGFPDAHAHASHLQTIKHVPKTTTLLELKEILCNDYYGCMDPQKLRQIRMGKLNFEEKSTRKLRREYKNDEEKKTITELHLQDGDTIGIDDRSSFVSNWKSVSSNSANLSQNNLSLTVKNSIDTTNTKPMTYSCLNTTFIEEVKLMAIQAFGLSIDPCMCRLHVDNPDIAHIPLYGHQTVGSIEFQQNNTSLYLKLGESLKENYLLLYVLSDREPCSLELVVDKSISLHHLWLLIKQELKMADDENNYHLCEFKPSLEDYGLPLNDFDETLEYNGLKNGAQLTMRPGSVATKNHVRLRVAKIVRKIFKPSAAIHTDPAFILEELQEHFELPVISPFNVLRERIAQCIEFTVPSGFTRDTKAIEFIRLYYVENDQPVSVVHEPGLTTLKQAKVEDLDTYGFELLSDPESLAKKDLLLNIVYSKDEDENYFQHQFKLHWPLKENIVAKYEYLEQHVLTQLTRFMINTLHFKNVSKQALKITLARYFPERAQWTIIAPMSTASSTQSTTRRSKAANTSTKANKSNLRLEPYKINDLVVIGVLEGENLTEADFDTVYDKARRKEIEEDKKTKRASRERNRSEHDKSQKNESNGRRKSPQNTMRIDVDDFDN